MARRLNTRERKVLDKLQFDHGDFHIKGKLPAGFGVKTLEGLVELGLVEMGQSERHYGHTGYRITPNGWRAMYGMTFAEIMARGTKTYPLKVWSWPPTPD